MPRDLDDAYRAFVAAQPGATLWHDADFLACFGRGRGRWTYAATTDADGALTGVLPAYRRRYPLGLAHGVAMPPLVRYCGPLLAGRLPPEQRGPTARALLAEARRLGLRFAQAWPREASAFVDVPEVAADFRIAERSTYLYDPRGTPADLLARATKSKRRRIRRAREHFAAERGPLGTADLAALRTPFRQQGLPVPYDEAVLAQAFALLHDRDLATCQRIVAPDGALAASAVCLWDAHRMYLWVIGSRAEGVGNAHAGTLAYAEMFALAQSLGLAEVDTLGSDLPGPAKHRRELGAVRHTYRVLTAGPGA